MTITNKPKSIDDYEIGKRLGRGKFGVVYICKEKSTNKVYAMKVYSKLSLKEDNISYISILMETIIQKNLNHPNILKVIGYFEDTKKIYIILECAEKGDLYKKMPNLKTKDIPKIIKQIVKGFIYLHENHVIHCDFKPENLLIMADGTIKISDFDSSIYTRFPIFKRGRGTPDYIAPEVLTKSPFDSSIDLWALGVFTFEMFHGSPLFYNPDLKMTFDAIKKFKFAYSLKSITDKNARDFIEKLVVFDPKGRMSAKECLNHPFLMKSI